MVTACTAPGMDCVNRNPQAIRANPLRTSGFVCSVQNMQSTLSADERFSANVRAELGARHITQSALATRMGWSQAKVSRLLSGAQTWDIDDAERIAVEFGTDVTPLLAPRAVA